MLERARVGPREPFVEIGRRAELNVECVAQGDEHLLDGRILSFHDDRLWSAAHLSFSVRPSGGGCQHDTERDRRGRRSPFEKSTMYCNTFQRRHIFDSMSVVEGGGNGEHYHNSRW